MTRKESRLRLYLKRFAYITGGSIGVLVLLQHILRVRWHIYHMQRTQSLKEQETTLARFNQARRDSDDTLLTLLETLEARISAQFPIESLLSQLRDLAEQQRKGENEIDIRAQKLLLWEQLKHQSLARYLSSIYSLSLLSILVNVQWLILQREIQLEHLCREESKEETVSSHWSSKLLQVIQNWIPEMNFAKNAPLTSEDQRAYLALSWHLLHEGVPFLCSHVSSCVQQVIGSVSLKTTYSSEEYSQLIQKIHSSVCEQLLLKRSVLSALLLPPHSEAEMSVWRGLCARVDSGLQSRSDESDTSPTLESSYTYVASANVNRLLNETRDHLSSHDTVAVIRDVVDSFLVVHLNEIQLTEPQPVASLIPIWSRLFSSVMVQQNNSYVEALNSISRWEAHSAIIFTTL